VLFSTQSPLESLTNRSGILAGGNWIVDRPKIIDVYPAQDGLANIIRETSNAGIYNITQPRDFRRT
jgi:hypothetical protein